MSFALVNAVLWPLAALVAAPVLIHLFARARPPEYRFSSVRFLRRVVRQTARLRRPRDLLLLAVRTLLVAAVVAVFLRPLLFADRRLAAAPGKRSVVAIVDASASMAYQEASQTRFAEACAQASQRLSALSAGDAANVVWMRARPVAVFPEMGVNLPVLQDALRRGRVTAEAADVDGAIALACRLLRDADGRREICLVSDFQRTAWEGRRPSIPAGIAWVAIRVGAADGINRALVRLRVSPSVVLAGETASVSCEVANYGPEPRRESVFLAAGESRQRQTVSVPAWGRATATFEARFPSPGAYPVQAQLEEDAFAADNQRWRVVEVRDRLRVGLLDAGQGTAPAWQLALDALGWVQVEHIGSADLNGALNHDALWLEGWDGSASRGVAAVLARGGAVVWMPSRATPAAAVWAAARSEPAPRRLDGEAVRWEESIRPRGLRLAAPDAPVFRVFEGGEAGDPARGLFTARYVLPPPAEGEASVLIAYDDGVPALARSGARGALWTWNLPLDRERSDWARQAEFVPLMGELLLDGLKAGGAGDADNERAPGDSLVWRAGRELVAGDVRIEDAARGRLSVAVKSADDGTLLVSEPVAAPGLHTWQYRSSRLGYGVVNFPVSESDLRAADTRALERMGFAVAGGGGRVRAMQDGTPLWPLLVAAAGVLLAIECGLALWIGRASS
jgi:hypothetical protein